MNKEPVTIVSRHSRPLGPSRRTVGQGLVVALALLPANAAAQSDPFDGQPASPATSGTPGPTPTPGPSESVPAPVPGCEHATAALCAKQNNAMLALDAGYVAACVFIAALLRAWFNKRATGSNAFRFLFPMLLAASGAGTLAALDPARSADLACCLASATFRTQILLQDSTIGRAVLFGALPAALVFAVVVFIIAKVRK